MTTLTKDRTKESLTLQILVRPAEEGGLWGEVLELPGCVSQGETEDDLFHNMMEAIEVCLEAGSEPLRSGPDLWRVPWTLGEHPRGLKGAKVPN